MFFLLIALAYATPCVDGWQSPSTGSGTCSHHGGVLHTPTYVTPTYIPTYQPPTQAEASPQITWEDVNACGVDVKAATIYKNGMQESFNLVGDETDIATFSKLFKLIGTPQCSTHQGPYWTQYGERVVSDNQIVKFYTNGVRLSFSYDPETHITLLSFF